MTLIDLCYESKPVGIKQRYTNLSHDSSQRSDIKTTAPSPVDPLATMSDSEVDYLSPSFNPSTLTVPRLRSILVSHDIAYPASAKKSQLIEIFIDQLLPRSRKILAARARTKRTSKGITDMPSSQESTVGDDDDDEDGSSAMPPPPLPATSRRRSSRNDGNPGTDESSEVLAAAPGQAKMLGGRRSSNKHARASDTEVSMEPGIKRPLVRKTRRSEITPTSAVKVEVNEPAGRPSLEGSAFSYDNPFQSGSSPLSGGLRSISAEKGRRSLGGSGERRKSSSRRRRTDGVSSENSRVKQEDGIVVPTSDTFDLPVARLRKPQAEVDGIEAGEEFTPDEQLELAQERAKAGHTDLVPLRRKKAARSSTTVSKSAPWVVFLTLVVGYAVWWRHEKVEVGYCGLERPSSMALRNIQLPDWASVLQPECEPCPQHAYCYTGFEARCEPDFLLKAHPLAIGGIVPLPPTCEPDGEKVRRVKAVADRAVEELRERRAKWECGGLVDETGKEVPAVEIDEANLKKEVAKKRRRGMGEAEFEELWKGAIGEIVARDEVVSGIGG